MVVNAFRGESGFVASLDKACREFVNRNSICKPGASKSPELLAKFCDALLRKSSKVTEEGEVEGVLISIVSRYPPSRPNMPFSQMTVFKYVEDKDVFQKFYSKMLAKRLVNSTSANQDMESSMISKLKEMCGYEYTSKLQRMFTDVALSKVRRVFGGLMSCLGLESKLQGAGGNYAWARSNRFQHYGSCHRTVASYCPEYPLQYPRRREFRPLQLIRPAFENVRQVSKVLPEQTSRAQA